VTTHSYRSYGDPDQQLLMSITAPVTAANVTITRNGRGQVTTATQGGFTRTFGYDTRYYLTSTIQPEVGTTTYGRDDAGNMTTKQVTAGPLGASGITSYDYDGRNRLWRVTYPNRSPSTVTNTYWRTDKLKTASNAVAVRSYGYDANQNLKTESLVVDGLTLAATYNYTTNDQLASIVYPVLNRTVSFDPDVIGRPRSVAAPAGSMLGVGFWPNGQIADVAYASGSRVTYGQNSREWLNAVTVQTGDGVKRIASVLTHDVAGNLMNVADSVDASYNRTLVHDAINRLSTAGGPWGSISATYDGTGNIRSYGTAALRRTYQYDAGTNRLSYALLESTGSASVPTGYSYDVYGAASPSLSGYACDGASNLNAASGRTYAYDATHKRVKTIANGITTYEFRSAQGLLLAEWKKDPGHYDTLKEHMHVAGKEVAEQQTYFLGADVLPSVGWMFLQHDASGSVISSTWAGGGLLFKENYQPYGSQINGSAQGYTQRAFAGHKQDAQDLIYMGARYYNPQIGRFLSIDPKEADPSDLHSLNRYAYANNNPYRYVDPDGYAAAPLSSSNLANLGAPIVQSSRAAGIDGMIIAGAGMGHLYDETNSAGGGGGAVGASAAGALLRREGSAVLRGATSEAAAVREITLSRGVHGEAAQHAAEAIKAGRPSVLTIDRAGAAANRQASTGALSKVTGKHLDEYPSCHVQRGWRRRECSADQPTRQHVIWRLYR
jgi:RHS repeat-associated protein